MEPHGAQWLSITEEQLEQAKIVSRLHFIELGTLRFVANTLNTVANWLFGAKVPRCEEHMEMKSN